MKHARVSLAITAGLGAFAPPASAGVLSYETGSGGRTLRYTSEPSVFTPNESVSVYPGTIDTIFGSTEYLFIHAFGGTAPDATVPTGLCDYHAPQILRCKPGSIDRLDIMLGPGDDHAESTQSLVPTRLFGGAGNDDLKSRPGLIAADHLDGGPGNDTLDAGAGPATRRGGDGDDTLFAGLDPYYNSQYGNPDRASDDFGGGAGTDKVVYSNYWSSGVTVTLDDLANDGAPGQDSDNVRSDIETVEANDWADQIFGTAGGQTLYGFGGVDTLNGGGGQDSLLGGPGNDTLNAYDSAADIVDCNAESDSATVDAGLDTTTACEQLDARQPDVDGDGHDAGTDC